MSKKIRVLLFGAVVLLTSCAKAVDDPTNIPVMGNWNSSVEIESVTIDGERFDNSRDGKPIPEEMASTLGGTKKTKEHGCIEPKVKTIEDLSERLPPNVRNFCTIKANENGSQNLTFESICDQSKLPKNVLAMQFTSESVVEPKLIEMTIRVQVTAKEEGGNSTSYIVQKNRFWRFGECAA